MPNLTSSYKIISIFVCCTFLSFPSFLLAQPVTKVIDSLKANLDTRLRDKDHLAEAYFDLGKAYAEEGQHSLAIPHFEKALIQAKQSKQTEMVLKALQEKAFSQNSKGESENALENFLQGLQLADSLNLAESKADFLFELGNYFRLQRNVKTAIDYLDQAEVIIQASGDQLGQCKILFTKASTYKISNNDAEQWQAIDIYQKMLAGDCRDQLSPYRLGQLYNNLGSTYTFLDEYEKAKEYLDKALKIKREVGNKLSLAFTLNELASLHFFQKNYTVAQEYGEEAYRMASSAENVFLAYDILENLAVASEAHQDYEKAYQYLHQSTSLRDSVQALERIRAIANLEMQYETHQKEQEILNQELQLTLQKTRYRDTLLLAALLSALAAMLFLWYQSQLRRKKLEAKNLEKIDELKTRYFTNISHELRTPLSLIIDPLQQLKASINNPAQQSLLKLASTNAQRMLRLINQILDLKKLEAHKMPLEAKPANINALLQAMIHSFQASAQKRKIDLQYISELDHLEVYFDAHKIEQVLYNLLSNALKFTPEGGKISVLLLQRNQSAEIMVKDNGSGIPADQLPYIFDRFYQADHSSTRQYEGSGIGLSLVKELVELHHGKVSVKSEARQGTSLSVQLPLGHQHLQAHEIMRQNTAPLENTENFHLIGDQVENKSAFSKKTNLPLETQQEKPILLVIEDHNELRNYLCQQLEKDYQVFEANNGRLGIEKALEHLPDLIISDIMMPITDGYELCKTLKADPRSAHIPIILLTAKSTAEERLIGLQSQADDYLSKPFDSMELQARISNLIQQRRQLQRLFNKDRKISPKEITVNSVDENFLNQLLEIVENKLSDESFGVESLSKAIGMSRSHLHRKLKALTGQSANIFLRSIRLQRAYQLLEQAAGSASEIAFEVGFSNPNYFFKCFKDEFGLTPGQVLKGEKAAEVKSD